MKFKNTGEADTTGNRTKTKIMNWKILSGKQYH